MGKNCNATKIVKMTKNVAQLYLCNNCQTLFKMNKNNHKKIGISFKNHNYSKTILGSLLLSAVTFIFKTFFFSRF